MTLPQIKASTNSKSLQWFSSRFSGAKGYQRVHLSRLFLLLCHQSFDLHLQGASVSVLAIWGNAFDNGPCKCSSPLNIIIRKESIIARNMEKQCFDCLFKWFLFLMLWIAYHSKVISCCWKFARSKSSKRMCSSSWKALLGRALQSFKISAQSTHRRGHPLPALKILPTFLLRELMASIALSFISRHVCSNLLLIQHPSFCMPQHRVYFFSYFKLRVGIQI